MRFHGGQSLAHMILDCSDKAISFLFYKGFETFCKCPTAEIALEVINLTNHRMQLFHGAVGVRVVFLFRLCLCVFVCVRERERERESQMQILFRPHMLGWLSCTSIPSPAGLSGRRRGGGDHLAFAWIRPTSGRLCCERHCMVYSPTQHWPVCGRPWLGSAIIKH
jgi:hypothetical protein